MPATPRYSLVCLAVHLALLNLAPSASAASLDTPIARSVQLPAGPLGRTLSALAVEAGIALSFDPALTAGLSSPALNGSYTARAALTLLLAGSGLEIVGRSDGSYTLQKAAPTAAATTAAAASEEQMLAVIRVRARRAVDGSTEGTGSYTSRVTSIASKTDQSFREIPQSVSVVTRQLLDDQDVSDIREAMALMPGVVVANNAGDFYSRGFLITSMQVDGGAPLALGAYTYSPQQDMAFYDRVEMMRGASGLLGGMGDPGGIINIVRKKPLAQRQVAALLSAGSWNNLRTELDASAPLTDDGRIRGRAVLSYQKGDSFLDRYSIEKPAVYGVLEADLDKDTLLTVGAIYGKSHQNGDVAGIQRYADGRSLGLPRGTNNTPDWAYTDDENKEVFAQLEHQFANRWKAKLNVTHVENALARNWAFLGGAVDPQTNTNPFWRGGHIDAGNKQDLVDLNLSGPFKLLGRTHELLLGVDWQRVRSHWQSGAFAGNGSVSTSVFDPQPWNPALNANPDTLYEPWGQVQKGAYGVLRLHPTDRLHVIAGARASRYDFDQTVWDIDPAGQRSVYSRTAFGEPTKVTPYGGVIYDIDARWSAYASYSAIYKPQALSMMGPPPGTSLAPVKGASYEGGVKGELLDGRLNATLSVFNVERTGTAVVDTRYPESTSLWNTNCCYLPQGKVTSRGVDLEVGGEVLPGWQLSTGYTYNHTRDDSTRDTYSSITPKHLLKLATSYVLPGALSQWKVGGVASVQSRQYVSGSVLDAAGDYQSFDFTQGGYVLLNAMAEYRIDPRWTLTLNVNNVFDKTYYKTLGSTFLGNYYGTPRNASLALRTKF